MTTLTVEINKERDLRELQAVLTRMGLKFELEKDDNDDDWADLSDAEIEGIKAGMEDIKAGRMHSHEYVMAHMEEKLNRLRAKHG